MLFKKIVIKFKLLIKMHKVARMHDIIKWKKNERISYKLGGWVWIPTLSAIRCG